MKETAENTITTELAKENVTEAVIANLKKQYLPLKINGIDDVGGYKKVHDARMVCRNTRTLAEKICKAGREDAVKEQKAWITKEKEVVALISEVEQHLKKQEDAIDQEKEAIKIRAERLLKLPGRKESVVGLEEYIGDLSDEQYMRFDDAQWNEILLIAKGKKLDAQQKVIDDANAKKLLERTIARENELIAVGAVLYSDGIGKVYRKGSASVTEQTIKECIDEGWPKIVQVFQKVVIPDAIPEDVKVEIQTAWKKSSPLRKATDEEILFHYSIKLEEVQCPILATDEGKSILAEAQSMLNEILTLLRK